MALRVSASFLRKPGKRPIKVETARSPQGVFTVANDARDEAAEIILDLPTPPSTNALFLNVPGVGRVKSAEYSNWLSEAGWMLAEQRPGRIAGAFSVEIEVSRPKHKRRVDLDNRVKGLLDLLTKHRVIQDDHLVQSIAIRWREHGEGVRVVVRKWEGERA